MDMHAPIPDTVEGFRHMAACALFEMSVKVAVEDDKSILDPSAEPLTGEALKASCLRRRAISQLIDQVKKL